MTSPDSAGRPRRHSGTAVAGLTLSILWIFGVGSTLGLVLGWSDIRRCRREQRPVSGVAVAAVVIGAIGLIGAVVSAALTMQLQPFDDSDSVMTPTPD